MTAIARNKLSNDSPRGLLNDIFQFSFVKGQRRKECWQPQKEIIRQCFLDARRKGKITELPTTSRIFRIYIDVKCQGL